MASTSWLPIETAPKDGTRVLAGAPYSWVTIVAFGDTKRRPNWYEGHSLGRLPPRQPTHWMRLPEPPEED